MKRTLIVFFTVLLISATCVYAELHDRGGGLIYDDVLDVTWLQDANYVNTTGYDDLMYGYDTGGQIKVLDAMTWAANLEYYDPVRNVTWSDWRLPKTLPINGVSYNYTWSYNGSADFGYNISAPGSSFPYSTNSEMSYMYYNNLHNFGNYDVNGNPVPNPGLINTFPIYQSPECSILVRNPHAICSKFLWTFGFYNGYQQSTAIG